ncbi:MAG: hypothetical protein LUQ71_10025, partial [Methanoregula sp.]|nr:hypothetical protein [Methanoregula sp.]
VPSELFGADAEKFAATFPKYILRDIDGDTIVNQTTGFYYKPAFVAGDVLSINQTDCDDYATNEQLDGTTKSTPIKLGKVNALAQNNWGTVDENDPSSKAVYFRAYQFSNPDNIGKYFYLDLLDPTGNIITRAKIDITG